MLGFGKMYFFLALLTSLDVSLEVNREAGLVVTLFSWLSEAWAFKTSQMVEWSKGLGKESGTELQEAAGSLCGLVPSEQQLEEAS